MVNDAAGFCNRLEALRSSGINELMVAEFIEGSEFTVALWDNDAVQALPLIQVDFSALPLDVPYIRTFDAKWEANQRRIAESNWT